MSSVRHRATQCCRKDPGHGPSRPGAAAARRHRGHGQWMAERQQLEVRPMAKRSFDGYLRRLWRHLARRWRLRCHNTRRQRASARREPGWRPRREGWWHVVPPFRGHDRDIDGCQVRRDVNTYEVAHVRWSETRLFMTLLMGSTMAIIMLGFMLGRCKNRRVNMVIVAASLVLFGLGTWLARSQTTVQETSYMSAIIPCHAIAILTSERSEIENVRVCELAAEIIEAQRREIAELEWLIEDIDQNGTAASAAQGEQRPVPEFE